MQAENLEELSENHNFAETKPSVILRELRWHGTLKRKRGPEVEAELRRKAKLGSLRIDDFCTTPPLDCVTCSLRMPF